RATMVASETRRWTRSTSQNAAIPAPARTVLTATHRSSFKSQPRKTVPIAPVPRIPRSSKRPSRTTPAPPRSSRSSIAARAAALHLPRELEDQLVRPRRLDDVVVRARLQALHAVARLPEAGTEEEGDLVVARRAHPAAELVAVHARHLDVGHHDLGGAGLDA